VEREKVDEKTVLLVTHAFSLFFEYLVFVIFYFLNEQ